MREGKYIIDSIENGLVKLLFTENETIEEIVKKEKFKHAIKQGDVLSVKFVKREMISKPLESETKNRREYAERLLEKLKKN